MLYLLVILCTMMYNQSGKNPTGDIKINIDVKYAMSIIRVSLRDSLFFFVFFLDICISASFSARTEFTYYKLGICILDIQTRRYTQELGFSTARRSTKFLWRIIFFSVKRERTRGFLNSNYTHLGCLLTTRNRIRASLRNRLFFYTYRWTLNYSLN